MTTVRLILGDCLVELPKLAAGSVDCVITDPPYPEIDRSYGRWTEAEWLAMMRVVVPECMRVLKPRGSAVFILQPNSERVGRMRTWLWEFMLWVGKEWGIVQDAWWWNTEAMPLTGKDPHMLRPSLKACVWVGPPHCYRNADGILWSESEGNRTMRLSARCDNELERRPSGVNVRNLQARSAHLARGGVTPFNVFPLGHDAAKGGHVEGHGASTPLSLASRWTRYLCPPGGTVLDPFSGTATVGLAAQQRDCSYIGIERIPEYHETAQRRLAKAPSAAPLFDPPAPVQPALFPEGAA